MKCPHCLVEINPTFVEVGLLSDNEGFWSAFVMKCPNSTCGRAIIDLANGQELTSGNNKYNRLTTTKSRFTVRPFASSRPPVPPEVDKLFADDYKEGCLTLNISPKASAALSRRCLQNILREKAGVKKGNLADEIQQVINGNSLPSHLSESIDAIRNVGNFAAHPIKSTSSGEIVDIEMGEAEWLLDVIESLFDFYFVQPAILKAKKDALNKKLADAGKPLMK